MDSISNDVAFLFDLDGVVIDTETQYDKFWSEIGKEFLPNVPNLNTLVKGQTLSGVLNQHFPKEVHQKIIDNLNKFEGKMPYEYIAGAQEFLKLLKSVGIKTAMVTSSNNEKMASVYKKMPELLNYFDSFVTSDKITRSKPDPMCYLLAAQELNVQPENCYVFEDSFFGLKSGRDAGMKVIGLATSNPREAIKDLSDKIIDNFVGISIEDIKKTQINK